MSSRALTRSAARRAKICWNTLPDELIIQIVDSAPVPHLARLSVLDRRTHLLAGERIAKLVALFRPPFNLAARDMFDELYARSAGGVPSIVSLGKVLKDKPGAIKTLAAAIEAGALANRGRVKLFVGDNDMGDAGVITLVDALCTGEVQLCGLFLAGNKMSDRGFKAIVQARRAGAA